MNGEPDRVDVERYLARIDHPSVGVGAPSLDLLTSLHRAHGSTVPFENLDILLGRPIRIDLPTVFDKIVLARRGGYCFEQNSLFAGVLDLLGFEVSRLAARVLMGRPVDSSPRTHMCLAVDIDGKRHLCDVGFGGGGPLEPVALVDGQETTIGRFRYRVTSGLGGWVLELHERDKWMALYTFTDEPEYAVDYELANHFTSTHPRSDFTQFVMVQRGQGDSQVAVRAYQLIEHRVDGVTTTAIDGDEALLDLLRDRFDLDFPTGTVFRPLHRR